MTLVSRKGLLGCPDRRELRSIWVAVAARGGAFSRARRLAAERPSASFDVTPANPRAGEPIQLTSSSCDPDGRLWSQDWDLDGDGVYGDATGATASAIFAARAHIDRAPGDERERRMSTQLRTVLVDAA